MTPRPPEKSDLISFGKNGLEKRKKWRLCREQLKRA
jgi:hypothetical protein